MPAIKYSVGSSETTIPLYTNEKISADKKTVVKIEGADYYAGLTSNLNNEYATKLRIKINDAIYAFMSFCKEIGNIILKNTFYKMSDVYPDTYQSMTQVPDELDTRNVTNMSFMFSNCSALTSVPEMDTSSATNMMEMFSGCSALSSVPEMDTSNATNMMGMFDSCSALTSVPELKVNNVTNMSGMFDGCKALKSVPKLDAAKAVNMSMMFSECRALTSIPELNTGNATNMSQMFYNCGALTSVPQLDTSKVTNAHSMFYYCTALKSVPKLDTSKVTDMSGMFSKCSSLPAEFPWAIDCTSIKAAKNIQNLFTLSSVKNVRLKNVATKLQSSITPTLLGDKNIQIQFIKTLALNDSKYKMSDIYPDTYQSMTEVPDELDTGNVTNMGRMFWGCDALTTVPEMNTSKVTDMNVMFCECSALTSVPEMDTSKVTNMIGMFQSCPNLTTIPHLDISKVTDMGRMFWGCTALTSVPEMNTSKVTNMNQMFCGCSSLPAEFPWAIDCSSVTGYMDLYQMFANSSVTKVTFKNLNPDLRVLITPLRLIGRAAIKQGKTIDIEFI